MYLPRLTSYRRVSLDVYRLCGGAGDVAGVDRSQASRTKTRTAIPRPGRGSCDALGRGDLPSTWWRNRGVNGRVSRLSHRH